MAFSYKLVAAIVATSAAFSSYLWTNKKVLDREQEDEQQVKQVKCKEDILTVVQNEAGGRAQYLWMLVGPSQVLHIPCIPRSCRP